MTDARSVLADLRAGVAPEPDAVRWFAKGLADGQVSDAQAGAFAMGVCHAGLGDAGRVALTEAMRDSGDTLAWDLPGPVIDKHSTGGIGDCVSLVLAPALAALDCYVPMISGRGLGHTGGTLDKLEAIPGLLTELAEDRFRHVVAEVGCAIVSASGQIAPADKRLYAVRDVTATVDSVDLITASILSKKLAAGTDALVLDVKVGSGAFMTDREHAQTLAETLVDTANGAGCKCSALLTDMDQPLAPAIGNAVEVAEVMRVLTGQGDTRLAGLTEALGGALLALAGQAESAEAGAARVREVIGSGVAAERFGRMVAAMGGPADFVEHWEARLPVAPVRRVVTAGRIGVLSRIDGIALGLSVVRLGGGRAREGDVVDPSVGLTGVARLGDRLDADTPLATIHAADEAAAERAEGELRRAVEISDHDVTPPKLIQGEVS
ncbi:thymidine phosphorylase [Tranquillimonas alkanivorans]|uniref:Thymidine phosphorylase n=1 Tax=Tranquillimonas alkanivorans TaxID=441119 RepID=A0A1I5SZH5_9RHOB|nr:thymidine phosphorylase [Tranquillimonas alkanivorans]SFP76170.1 thymidine phosphorylase [Tranquillimonas alkanivorans]